MVQNLGTAPPSTDCQPARQHRRRELLLPKPHPLQTAIKAGYTAVDPGRKTPKCNILKARKGCVCMRNRMSFRVIDPRNCYKLSGPASRHVAFWTG